MAAGQWTGFLEKLHSPGMRSGAVSRLFAGTADRDTSCPRETKRLCTSGANERTEKRQILFTHILPHIWIPVLNYLGPASAFLLTGSFVVESIFTIPGLGRQFVSSIANRDYTLILGLTIFMGAVVILIQLAVDLLSACIDPRVRRSYVDEE